MEEKERYYIRYDMIIDTEKTINGEPNITVCDTDDLDRVIDLLNQQDKGIQQLKQSIKEERENLQQLYSHLGVEAFGEDIQEQAVKEIDNIKQSQKQLAISELEKVKDTVECVLDDALKNSSLNQSYYDRLLDEIDNQIKSLKGEE